MKITNKTNIPSALYKAICNEEYDRGDSDITVTTLIKPTQVQILEKKHWQDIEIDVLDNLCMFLGHSLHKALEDVTDGAIVEQRFYKDFDLGELGTIKLGGCVDFYDPFTATIVDYKLTNVFSVKEGCKVDWEHQLNCYAHLVRSNGMPVTSLKICSIIKDWQRSQAANNPDYPAQPVIVIDVPVWDEKTCDDFIVSRLKAYVYGKKHGMYVGCTDEELWKQPDIWKVFKGSNIRATKCFGTKEEAQMFLEGNPDADKFRVQLFPGKRNRCENFCRVAKWCPQYQQYLQDQTANK